MEKSWRGSRSVGLWICQFRVLELQIRYFARCAHDTHSLPLLRLSLQRRITLPRNINVCDLASLKFFGLHSAIIVRSIHLRIRASPKISCGRRPLNLDWLLSFGTVNVRLRGDPNICHNALAVPLDRNCFSLREMLCLHVEIWLWRRILRRGYRWQILYDGVT